MKKLLALLLLSPIAFAEKNEMIPLREYIENQDNNIDELSFMYVNLRCIALTQWMRSLMQVSTQKESNQEAIKIAEENLTKLLNNAEVIYKAITPENEQDYTNFINLQIIPMMDNYQLESDKSFTNTGEVFNSYIKDEIYICGNVANT